MNRAAAAFNLLWVRQVRGWFYPLLGYFLTPAGVLVMAALDASLVFFLPLGIDFVVIIMAARRPELFWLHALLAAAGSVAGAAGTYWIGRQAGERGLARLVSARRLERVRKSVDRGAALVAAMALVPPPFPFTPFVLASGALRMNPYALFPALAFARLLRFGVEAALAARYGRQILRWMNTPLFETIVGVLIVLAIVGTIVSAVALTRGSRMPLKRAA